MQRDMVYVCFVVVVALVFLFVCLFVCFVVVVFFAQQDRLLSH